METRQKYYAICCRQLNLIYVVRKLIYLSRQINEPLQNIWFYTKWAIKKCQINILEEVEEILPLNNLRLLQTAISIIAKDAPSCVC